jgi:hypothetical protein
MTFGAYRIVKARINLIVRLLDRVVDAQRVDAGGAGLHLDLGPMDAGLVVGEDVGQVPRCPLLCASAATCSRRRRVAWARSRIETVPRARWVLSLEQASYAVRGLDISR